MILGHIYAAHPPPHLGGYGSGAGALAIMKWQCPTLSDGAWAFPLVHGTATAL
jgi:hypothetical protein